jgi:hypothetical protein
MKQTTIPSPPAYSVREFVGEKLRGFEIRQQARTMQRAARVQQRKARTLKGMEREAALASLFPQLDTESQERWARDPAAKAMQKGEL